MTNPAQPAPRVYTINEAFLSVQGEGHRAGTLNVFIRFTGCNLQCRRDGEAGFDCDTEFSSGSQYHGELAIVELAHRIATEGGSPNCRSVIFTGGEPALQVTQELIEEFRDNGWFTAIETNGTRELPRGIDWVSCSPKTAEHTLKVDEVNELRYVRAPTQAIPKPSVRAEHLFLSPAFLDGGNIPDPKAVQLCLQLIRENPHWRLSIQAHKLIRVR